MAGPIMTVGESMRAGHPPKSSNRFRVIATLGEGGTATVQLAVAQGPLGFNKLVVLKALRPALMEEPEVADMFRYEARLAAQLNHPNIVQTYEVVEDGEQAIIVMEYLEGQPLSKVIERATSASPLPLAMHVQFLCETLAALHYAHELADYGGAKLGIVHRDVSPQNVFVSYEGQVKLLDFGIAKATERPHSETEVGVLKGKVRYMAPEQMLGDPVDRRADIFAVGIMLWEALTGKSMWAEVPDVVVMNRVTSGEIPSLRIVTPDVNAELERICVKALELDAPNRYATAREFQLELEKGLAAIGPEVKKRDVASYMATLFADTRAEIRDVIEARMGASEDTHATPLEPSPPRHEQDTLREKAVARKGRLDRMRTVAVLVTVLVLAGVVGGIVFRERTGPAPQPLPSATVSEVRTVVVAPSASAEPQVVEFRVAVSPPEARIFVDGRLLDGNPVAATFPRDETTRHKVRMEATGFVTRELDVTFGASSTVALSLTPQKLGVRGTKPIPHVEQPEPSAKKSSCAQPFYVDSDGIKRIRVECL